MSKGDLLLSIKKSEGRVVACETITSAMPMLVDITNAEFVCGMGADLIILNMFDILNPSILGLPEGVEPSEVIREVKRLTGRPVGINLEPVVDSFSETSFPEGRKATLTNALSAVKMGVDMIVLTGNPGTGVSNKTILSILDTLRQEVGDKIILVAGKMHAAGVLGESGERIITRKDIKDFTTAGADIILLPAPGTTPGITAEYIHDLVEFTHNLGAMTMTAIGTSQEGADEQTIRSIALMCKMTGTDIHHLGDAGYFGMALPENIVAYSTAIRGIRHTYRRMVGSVNR